MRIIHISDLHFGMHQDHIKEAFLAELALLKPVVIIISGDLTQRAKAYQFELLQSFLRCLPGKVLVVPGNHDIPLYNLLGRIFYPFKAYKKYIAKHFNAQLSTDSLTILGINSVDPHQIKDGRLSSKVIKKIKQYFRLEKKAVNILFFHHNFDHIEGLHKPLENEMEFLSFLRGSDIDIVCTGHLHYAHVGLIRKDNMKPCVILHAGTLLCTRSKDGLNSYFVIDLEGDQCAIDWRVFAKGQFLSRKNYSIKLSEVNAQLSS
ncbi:TPA: metallophosphoesterase [Legionella feeleii]